MPVHITKFPSKDFDAQFDEAVANVWSYFDNAWIISKAVGAQKSLKTKKRRGGAKGAKPKSALPAQKGVKSRGSTPVIERFMQELSASESFVRQAKQCGDAFDYNDVLRILELCEEHGVVPSRDLFIQLVPVPVEEQMVFAEEMIREKFSTRVITQKRIERYGRTSKGTKKPKAPTTLFEANEQLIKEQTRVNALGVSLLSAVQAGSSESAESGFVAPPGVAPKIRTALRALASLRKLLEEAIEGSAA